MGISTSQFKQLFNFLSDPRNTNIVFVISKNIKLFHEKFGTILSMVYRLIQPSLKYQINQGE